MNLKKDIPALIADTGCEVKHGVPMKKHTSFRIGGLADVFVAAKTTEQLMAALNILKENKAELFILGNGTNLLVSDKGIRGVVLKLGGEFEEIDIIEENGAKLIRAGAGALLSNVCKFARDNSLSGLEFAYGIPGTIGGAVYMNAGAYGGEISDVIVRAEHVSRDGLNGSYNKSELSLSYRHSIYSGSDEIITRAYFTLQEKSKDEITAKMNELMQKRLDKQPYAEPSAGSTFKRPEGAFAAALIEESGLKGKRIGSAQVSEKHAGFIINTEAENGKCADVLELINYVKKDVKEKKNIDLECEVKLVGEGF